MTINDVSNVIFISTRWIPKMSVWENENGKEESAKHENYLVFSASMAEFFNSLDDDCSKFLKSTVKTGILVSDVINNFLEKIKEMGLSDKEIIISQDIGRPALKQKLCDLMRPDFDLKKYNTKKSIIINSKDLLSHREQIKALLPKIDAKETEDGLINSYNNEEILIRPFKNDKKDISHLDMPVGEKTIKKRLGIYKKDIDTYGLCAIWPWSGEYDKERNHDEEWEKTICKTILEFYPNAKTAIILLHDRDFQAFEKEGKDDVIGWFDYGDDSKKLHYCLVVFRHNNIDIQNIIQIPQNIKELYEVAFEYANGYVEVLKADSENKNAIAHKNAIKDQKIS